MRKLKRKRKRELFKSSKVCYYCGNPDRFEFTIDHKLPFSRGGTHALSNLVCACFRCNCAKGDMTDVEFVTYANMLGWPWLQRSHAAYGHAQKYARARRIRLLQAEFSRLERRHKKEVRA